jgi:hypothetical protein
MCQSYLFLVAQHTGPYDLEADLAVALHLVSAAGHENHDPSRQEAAAHGGVVD